MTHEGKSDLGEQHKDQGKERGDHEHRAGSAPVSSVPSYLWQFDYFLLQFGQARLDSVGLALIGSAYRGVEVESIQLECIHPWLPPGPPDSTDRQQRQPAPSPHGRNNV